MVSERYNSIFLLMCGNKKKSLVAKLGLYGHQFDVLADQNGVGLVSSDSSSLVRFSNFHEDFRQTDCGVPLRIDRPTMLMRNSRHMANFAEETGHHLFRNDFFINNIP